MQPNAAETTETPTPAPSLPRRLILLPVRIARAIRPRAIVGWLAGGRLRLILVGTGAVVLCAAVVAANVMLRPSAPAEPPVTFRMALTALEKGHDTEAKQLAEKLQKQGDLSTQEWGGPDFVLGILAVHEAQATLEKQKVAAYRTAAEYLQKAYDHGFPAGREGPGLYWLGESLYLSGRMSASRPILQAALKASPTYRSEIHRRLADAWLNETPPSLEKALAENEQVLAAKELSPAERSEGQLQRAQILLRLGRPAECAHVLDEIPAKTGVDGEVAALRGRMLYQEAQTLAARGDSEENRKQVRAKYEAAIKELRLAQQRDTVSNRATPQAMYLTAMCLLAEGKRTEAVTLFGRVSKLYAGTAEGTAAAFREAEESRRMGNDKTALAAYRDLLAVTAQSPEFHNPWVSLQQLQTAVLAACREYLGAGKFEMAQAIGRLLAPPLVLRVRALEVNAQIHQDWGQNLLGQAAGPAPSRAEESEKQGRQQLRIAGELYAQLARQQVTSRLYPELIWKSAAAYGQGQDYRSAARMLRIYLQNESRKRHAQGLVELGETLLALGENAKAMETLRRCIEQYPRDAVTYRARLVASRVASAQGDVKVAEALLRDNLNGHSLTPASKEWRDSLFALGQLLADDGRSTEAIRRLEEAVTRYPEAARAIEARYLIAGAACRAAEALSGDYPNSRISENGTVPFSGTAGSSPDPAEAKRYWEKALYEYREVRGALAGVSQRDLLPAQRAMLRNCRFALGEVLAALGRYDEAVAAYTEAANSYSDRPESLEAYVEIAKVYRRLDRTADARTSIEQARLALARIPGNARFDETTSASRKQWNELLDWMGSL